MPKRTAPETETALTLIRPFFSRHRHRIALGISCLIIVDFLQLTIPRIVKHAVDGLTASTVGLSGLGVYAAEIMALAVFIGVFRYVWRWSLMGTARRVEEGLRNRLFDHVQRLSPAYFDRTKTGDIMAHATNDIDHIRMAAGMGTVALVDAVVLGTAAIGFMAYIQVTLTLLVILPMPFIAFGTRIFSRQMHRRYQAVQAAFADMTEAVRERFSGIRVIKAYTMETATARRLEDFSTAYVRRNLQLVRVTGAFFPLMVFFSDVSLALVLYFGGRGTITAAISPGDFVAFIGYLGLLTWPMMALGWVTNLVQRGKASLDRIAAILNTRPEIDDPPMPATVPAEGGDIVFSGVRFAYEGSGGRPALEAIDLTIGRGTMLGVVGPPGSGKTTLAGLIPRLYDVTAGRITIAGTDIRMMALDDLRRHIALMPQEPYLFAGSIAQNITGFSADRDLAEMERAAGAAALADAVHRFDRRYETTVGERGVMLSGGQKQRVALARVLYGAPPILIFDDPISQVDTETGHRIVQTLQALAGRHTVIVTSHRLSAVRSADRIIVLDTGRIIESGDHAALMARSGYYARTWRLQEIAEGDHVQ